MEKRMFKISIKRILDYYEVPQLILCVDSLNNFYLATIIDDREDLIYFASQISIDRLNNFLSKKEDLLSIYKNTKKDLFCKFQIADETISEAEATNISFDAIKQFLPLEGLFVEGELEEFERKFLNKSIKTSPQNKKL